LILDENKKLKIMTKQIPQPNENQVLIKMLAVSLNRRDYWITRGQYMGVTSHVTLGSDGCGLVVDVGNNVDRVWLDKIVVLNPGSDWGDDENANSLNYRILGMPHDGTFAEYIVTHVDRIYEKPDYLTVEEAAALPLAGLTAYRALFVRGGYLPSMSLLVPGIGSGVAQFVAQFASCIGGDVWVTSSSDEKINKTIKKLGVTGGINYKEKDWGKKLMEKSGTFDLIVDGVGGNGFNQLLRVCNLGGKIVSYGATDGTCNVNIPILFIKQIQWIGTTMGSDRDFEEMLKFSKKHQIRPVIHSIMNFNQIISAIEQMETGDHIGKIVLNFSIPKL